MKASITVNPQQAFNRLFTPAVLLYANERVYAYCDPYVPFRDGDLSKNVTITKDAVTYTSRYANRQYKGEDFNFRKDYHPLATAQWDKAMKIAKGQQVADDISDFIKRGES